MEGEIFKEYHKRRNEGNELVLNQNFTPFKRFYSIDTLCYQDGEIPVKYKEIMGLVASLVLRCKDCILYHIERSIIEGATRNELNEAMNISLVVGGSIIIPELRFALKAIDEKFNSLIQNENINGGQL
ncbi:MAG: carboxymuconolactone decarboxylase family protein [Candidatus Kapaibacteriota bacterium]